jgi:hypothetical protein
VDPTREGDEAMSQIIVNSLSGGKTSSYMAAHYPADYNIFSLVRIEALYCKPKDASIVKYVSDKLGLDFIATAESDTTLYVLRDLEQVIGKNIIWTTGDSFEKVISKKKALPNKMWRFCTTEMKMKPIFDYCQNQIQDIVTMQIGFRYDEKERANKENTQFKTIVGKSTNGRNKWGEVYWRELKYPMIEDQVMYPQVISWVKSTNLIFPPDSNCVGCFWKPLQQLRRNWEDEPQKMKWFSEMETKMKRKFKKEMSYDNVKKIGLQQDFTFGTGSGCQAGFCTD